MGMSFLKNLLYCFMLIFRFSLIVVSGKLFLDHHIILNDTLFMEVLGIEFTRDTPFMHGNLRPTQVETSLEDAKVFLPETRLTSPNLVTNILDLRIELLPISLLLL